MQFKSLLVVCGRFIPAIRLKSYAKNQERADVRDAVDGVHFAINDGGSMLCITLANGLTHTRLRSQNPRDFKAGCIFSPEFADSPRDVVIRRSSLWAFADYPVSAPRVLGYFLVHGFLVHAFLVQASLARGADGVGLDTATIPRGCTVLSRFYRAGFLIQNTMVYPPPPLPTSTRVVYPTPNTHARATSMVMV